jgi:hypothetical protein
MKSYTPMIGLVCFGVILLSFSALFLMADQLQATQQELQRVGLVADVTKREYFELQDRVINTEETAHQVLCKLSTLEEEYTGCGGGPVGEPDGDGWGSELEDDYSDDDEPMPLVQMLTQLDRLFDDDGNLFGDAPDDAMPADRGNDDQ